jgi:hypothetical protein
MRLGSDFELLEAKRELGVQETPASGFPVKAVGQFARSFFQLIKA